MSAVVILLALDARDAHAYLAAHPELDGQRVEWATVRSPKRIRGYTASAVRVTDGARAHPSYQSMVAEAMPCLIAGGAAL